MNKDPDGKLFSELYADRGAAMDDGPRMRRRIGAFLDDERWQDKKEYQALVLRETGESIGEPFSQSLGKLELVDFMDVLIRIWRWKGRDYQGQRTRYVTDDLPHEVWRQTIARVFAEENLAYEVNAKCEIRRKIDPEFADTRESLLAGLGRPRYTAVRQSFQEATQGITAVPCDTKAAVRAAFDAVENLVKMMVGGARLESSTAAPNGALQKAIAPLYAPDPTAKHVVPKMVQSLADWIDGAHFYRHAPGKPEPIAPPVEIAVLIVSQGAAILRWLLDVDARLQSAAKAPAKPSPTS